MTSESIFDTVDQDEAEIEAAHRRRKHAARFREFLQGQGIRAVRDDYEDDHDN